MTDVHDVSTTPTADETEEVFCPSCGYDLRGSQSDRCSECGTAIDRATLSVSAIPWAHRKETGRLKAYWRTVWAISLDYKRIRREHVKPQDDRDATRFRWANAAVLTVSLLLIASALVLADGLRAIVVHHNFTSRFAPQPLPGWKQDLLVPWSAGVSLWPAIPFYLACFAYYLCGVGRSMYRHGSRPAEHVRRARAVSDYAAAPLFWLFPAALAFAVCIGLNVAKRFIGDGEELRTTAMIAGLLALVLGPVGLLNWLWRSSEWVARVHHGGGVRFLLATSELLLWTAVGGAVYFGVIPWCAGYWRIAVAS